MSKRRKPQKGPREWTRFVQVEPASGRLGPGEKMYTNSLYTVIKRDIENTSHLSIRRNDRKPIRDWRHFQRIKNELVGPECEGMELFPAESRLIDMANQYHLWCLNDGTRLQVGFDEGRKVLTNEETSAEAPGAVQRNPE